jgi:hypothetical protein
MISELSLRAPANRRNFNSIRDCIMPSQMGHLIAICKWPNSRADKNKISLAFHKAANLICVSRELVDSASIKQAGGSADSSSSKQRQLRPDPSAGWSNRRRLPRKEGRHPKPQMTSYPLQYSFQQPDPGLLDRTT